MSDPVLILEYEVTIDDLREYTRRASRGFRHRFYQFSHFLAAAYILWIGVGAWEDGSFWMAAFCLTGGLFMMFSDHLLHWWLFRVIGRTQPPATVRLEVDQRSLLIRNCAHRFGNRLWWSRLTNCQKRDGEFELSFDGETHPSMYIPDRAFADDQQRTTFRSLVDRHLPQSAVSQTA